MERQEMLKWKKAAWQKLMGAIAMLLVASIMMSATSYAWFVLSTAPEVTDLTTTAGANGALEIALQSNKADGTGRADILSGVGQSVASKEAQTANACWGNVVDLSEGYGLEHITLYPARLNLNGEVVNTTSMLSIPTFGTDGRVTSLKNAEKTYFKDGKFEQGQSHWGVNVMGATSDQAGVEETITLTYNRDFVLNEARTKVAECQANLREQMTNAIEKNSLGIMGYLIFLSGYDQLPDSDLCALVSGYAQSMLDVIDGTKTALQWALMANAAADQNIKSDNEEEMKALGALYAECLTLPLTAEEGQKSVASWAETYGYSALKQAAEDIAAARVRVSEAKRQADNGNSPAAILALIDENNIVMHGSYLDNSNVQKYDKALAYNFGMTEESEDGKPLRYEDSVYMLMKAQGTSNLFSVMASVIGDYAGDMTVWERAEKVQTSTGGYKYEITWVDQKPELSETVEADKYVYTIKGTSKTTWSEWDTQANTGTLGAISDQINGITAPGTIQVELTRSDLSAYGYSVDLALQCSKNTNLQLQQKAVARVDGDTSGQTMGSGSTMVFDLAGDLSEEQVRKLMQGIYVVLMNTDSGEIYKIAAVDPDQLTVDQLQYPNRATGTLTLYEPVIQNGVLSLGDKANSIAAMTADTQLNLTALVFLNGDQVDASMFSGTQALSLTGTLNLQFASSETLTAMEYTDYAPEKTTDNP